MLKVSLYRSWTKISVYASLIVNYRQTSETGDSIKYFNITFTSSKVFSVDLNEVIHYFGCFFCTNCILVTVVPVCLT